MSACEGEVGDFSVIIPAFNREQSLPRAVRSALNQEPPPREVIVVDDGSTDGTVEAVAPIVARSPRVRVIQQNNAGAASARNLGLEHASGEWIAFLDSDDEWLPGRLARLQELLTHYPTADFIHGDRHVVLADGSTDEIQIRTETQQQAECRRYLISYMRIKTSTVFVRRDLFERAGGGFDPRLRTCEDYELFWRMVLAARRILYDPTVQVLCHQTDESLTEQDERPRIRDHLRARRLVVAWATAARIDLDARVEDILSRRLNHEVVAGLRNAAGAGPRAFVVEIAWLCNEVGVARVLTALQGVVRRRTRRLVGEY